MMASKKQVKEFIEQMIPIAQRQAKNHNNKIFASVCIAQACHESGYGTSAKMIKANAVYGIKVGRSAYRFGNAWKGKAYKTGTTEYYDGVNPTRITDFFRAYDSIEDATEDYFDMLCHCKRYKPALNQSTPQECIEKIVQGGYATGPEYADHIMKIIRSYNLTRYDHQYEVKKYPAYTGSSSSIVEALEAMGIDSSAKNREKIYDVNFTDVYRKTAKQNTAMLILLKQGILIRP